MTYYESEAAMCAQFCEWVRLKGWTPYAETAGWDVLCVAPDGFQIGVQAKLTLNPAVVCQALEDDQWLGASEVGPDCRAVLAPAAKSQHGMARICAALGVTVIKAAGPGPITITKRRRQGFIVHRPTFEPDLPDARNPWKMDRWFDLCTTKRLKLPEYVPDVTAGASGPVQLTDWKVRAIKIAVLAERRGYVTRSDFAALKISIHRWLTLGWLTYRGRHTEAEWRALVAWCGFRCCVCRAPHYERDHVIPLSDEARASDAIENLQPLCASCNARKGAKVIDYRPADWRRALP